MVLWSYTTGNESIFYLSFPLSFPFLRLFLLSLLTHIWCMISVNINFSPFCRSVFFFTLVHLKLASLVGSPMSMYLVCCVWVLYTHQLDTSELKLLVNEKQRSRRGMMWYKLRRIVLIVVMDQWYDRKLLPRKKMQTFQESLHSPFFGWFANYLRWYLHL